VLADDGSNTVNATLSLSITVTGGRLSSYPQGVLTLSGDGVVEDMEVFDPIGKLVDGALVSIEATDELQYRTPLRTMLTSSNSPLDLTYKYKIKNHVCKRGSKQVFRTGYLNGLNVNVNNIKFTMEIPADNVVGFKPGPSSVNSEFTNGSKVVELTYSDSTLGMGEGDSGIGVKSEFDWEPAIVASALKGCPEFQENDFFFLYALIIIPSIAVTCLILSAFYHRFYVRYHPDAPSPFRLGIYPGTRDIVLAPTDHEETVEAVIDEEEDTALDAIMPVTSIRVSIDEYFPPGAAEAVHVPRPNNALGEQTMEEVDIAANDNVQVEIETAEEGQGNDETSADENTPPAKSKGKRGSVNSEASL